MNGSDPNDSVICLDSPSAEATSDDDGSFSVSDFVNFEKTLAPGVAPDGFILLDESVEVTKPDKDENFTGTKNEEKEVEKPMFKVLFRDETVARQYKKRVRDFLHKLVGAEDKNDNSETSSLVLDVWSNKTSRKRSCDYLDNEIKNGNDDSKGVCDELLFTIDKKPLMQDRLDVPTYGKKYDRIMVKSSEGDTQAEEEEKTAAPRPKMSCWNCLGNHSIRDCPEPRNAMEIAKNRTLFQTKSGPKMGRYHVDDDQSKFGHFVPGQISKELKRALGIRENELPYHIYRMRMLGYPPGWLKEARLQHSGMNLYDSDGLRELDPMEEPGQIPEPGDKDQYDVKKIHDFPGFNVPPPSGTREQEKMYWQSDQYFMHSKESMLAMLNEKKVDGYKRKKLKRGAETISGNAETVSSVPSEMDVVEEMEEGLIVEEELTNGKFVPPLPKSPVRPPLPSEPEEGAVDSPKPANVDVECVASPSYVDSPTLADLEKRKKQLLDELEDSNSAHSAPSTPVTSRSGSANSENSRCDQTENVASSAPEATSKSEKESSSPLVTPSRGTVKSVALGTPILESTSPYSKLPSVEKFSKDVCDIINFENLPDSTGKYEQMTGILQKVRSTLATIQQD